MDAIPVCNAHRKMQSIQRFVSISNISIGVLSLDLDTKQSSEILVQQSDNVDGEDVWTQTLLEIVQNIRQLDIHKIDGPCTALLPVHRTFTP
jgi:hypothetical protein